MLYPNLMNREYDWSELDQMQRAMNRLFDQISGDRVHHFPLINLYANAEGAVITAELPGFNPKNVQLTINGDELLMIGTRPKSELHSDEICHRQERSLSNFERHVRLPFAVDADKVQAKFKNGILTISLSRADADKSKKIQIKTN